MKTDFVGFRKLRGIALALMLAAIVGFAVCWLLFEGIVAAQLTVAVALAFGIPACLCLRAAQNGLRCPHCGKPVAGFFQASPFDKKNQARLKSISRKQPIECPNCNQAVETA